MLVFSVKLMGMLLLGIIVSLTTFSAIAQTPDHYVNFLELSKHEAEGQAYRVERIDRKSAFTIIAIHGGGIERGSGELARVIAGDDLNLYLFEGLKITGNQLLHVTSNHFDDPRALSLLGQSKVGISIHGFKEDTKDEICVGGGNVKLREQVARELTRAKLNLTIETPCKRFEGDRRENIVNRSKDAGVQLELSTHLRKRFISEAGFLNALARAIRKGIGAAHSIGTH